MLSISACETEKKDIEKNLVKTYFYFHVMFQKLEFCHVPYIGVR